MFLCIISASNVWAACPDFTPEITLKIPEYKLEIDKDATGLSERFGEIEANLISNYTLKAEEVNGCLKIDKVEAIINFNYVIRIDKNIKNDSCLYKEVLRHETEHLKAYESVIYDMENDILESLNTVISAIKYSDLKGEISEEKMDDFICTVKESSQMNLIYREINMESAIRNKAVENLIIEKDDCE